jgi:hypothetical protein
MAKVFEIIQAGRFQHSVTQQQQQQQQQQWMYHILPILELQILNQREECCSWSCWCWVNIICYLTIITCSTSKLNIFHKLLHYNESYLIHS